MVNPNEGFWEQLEQYEHELLSVSKQCQDNHYKDDTGQDYQGTNEHFDSTWALRSSALYSTCREISGSTPVVIERSWYRLANFQTHEQIDQLLFVGLDFLWGRGILDVDLDWFMHLCRHIPPKQAPFQRVRVMLKDPESKFSQTWSGEIYPEQVHKILNALGFNEDNKEESLGG